MRQRFFASDWGRGTPLQSLLMKRLVTTLTELTKPGSRVLPLTLSSVLPPSDAFRHSEQTNHVTSYDASSSESLLWPTHLGFFFSRTCASAGRFPRDDGAQGCTGSHSGPRIHLVGFLPRPGPAAILRSLLLVSFAVASVATTSACDIGRLD